MNLAELDAELSKDPAYIQAGRELKPILDFADDVLRLRTMRDLTTWQLANSLMPLNHTRQWVDRLEAGLANPSVSDLLAVARALDAALVIRLVPNEEGE